MCGFFDIPGGDNFSRRGTIFPGGGQFFISAKTASGQPDACFCRQIRQWCLFYDQFVFHRDQVWVPGVGANFFKLTYFPKISEIGIEITSKHRNYWYLFRISSKNEHTCYLEPKVEISRGGDNLIFLIFFEMYGKTVRK